MSVSKPSGDKAKTSLTPAAEEHDISGNETEEEAGDADNEEDEDAPFLSGKSRRSKGTKVGPDGTLLCRKPRKSIPHDVAEDDDEEEEEIAAENKYNEFCGEGEEEDESCIPNDGGAWDWEPCEPDEPEPEIEEEIVEDDEDEEEEPEFLIEAEVVPAKPETPRYSQEMETEEFEEEEEEEDEFQPIEDDELKTLFMGKMDMQQEVETLADIEGVVGLTLSPQTRHFFRIDNEEMMRSDRPVHKWLSWKKVKLHIFQNGEESEFFPYYNNIKYYPDVTMLLGSDIKKETGHDYFFCLTIEARNNVLNPKRRKKVAIDLKKQQEQIWNDMASKAPRKWRGYGSEVEVQDERISETRPLIAVQVYRYRQYFGKEYRFEEAPKSVSSNFFASFKSEPPENYPSIQTVEVDRAVQVMPQKKDTATQTGFSFKRNKMIQYSTQSITDKNVANIMGSKGMVKFFKRVMPQLDKVLQQNEMVDLLHDDYRNLKCKRGREMEFSKDSLLLQEYQTYSHKHSRGRTVTCMVFHPVLEDVVVMATAVDLTWERRIDAHSKSLMEPNYVLFWDLRDSAHPHIMLDAPADVFSFMINPSEPHLVCGGCANGQIALWDLGRTYFELRAKIQDRKTINSDSKNKRPTFLDKLKDSAESLVCPLISVAGLSNLDMSHKRAVTSVAWVPAHIEIGKNGMVYDNRTSKSCQFMSVAGDGTLRLWDIRPQKKLGGGGEDDDEDNLRDMIKVNKWAHLENNQWKYHFRYSLEDDQGIPLFATSIILCEKKSGDRKVVREEGSKPTEANKGETDQSDEPHSGADEKHTKALVQNLKALTTMFLGTEMGAIALIDWLRNKDAVVSPDFGNKTLTNIYLQAFHHGAITTIKRSPFYPEMLLVVGGGIISIWKETCPYPIFLSGGFDVFPWCAIWSNSRPAVFYVGNREGSVSIWDLMDRSNGPVMTQAVTNVNITGIGIPKIAASASKNQYLAVTDSDGVLIVLLLPRFYARPLPNEDHVMTELMNREDNRMSSWAAETESRADKIQTVNYNWEQSRITKTAADANREEIQQEHRLNEEYKDFIEFEKTVVDVLKQGEPALPTMDNEISDEFDAMILAAQKSEQVEEEAAEDEDLDDFDDFGDFDDEDYDD